MPAHILDLWEHTFRIAAKLDNYRAASEHLDFLSLDSIPKDFVDGTVNLIRMQAAYCNIDNQPLDKFLNLQDYTVPFSSEITYIYTFDLCGKAYARAFDDSEHKQIDLADLFGSPWEQYEVVGYHQFWISRVNRGMLTRTEIKDLSQSVKSDLYFDYGTDEIELDFNVAADNSFLHVSIESQS